MDDERFFQLCARFERSTARLLRDPHYGPIIRSDGSLAELEEMRIERREREERARARELRAEASLAEG
ncbi:hypothetical protein Csp2054_10660 [Curtobacterium sp. 'Ferrero']|uniref:hypothetical protein n=1 Tax=Curtobacterium sp. 'Ferrero' TaxID=2033654 RepID=UPI000BDB4801|nr:hypothetical protein [Curtobacterium sp. 'Ferrero']PCN47816.1 hypothetical protein Csp2054_10660 [Curtobacterium sp. 'Ferrero']